MEVKRNTLVSQNVYYKDRFCLVNSATKEGDGERDFTIRDLRTNELWFHVERKEFLTLEQLKNKLNGNK